jgi:hypothetical protein
MLYHQYLLGLLKWGGVGWGGGWGDAVLVSVVVVVVVVVVEVGSLVCVCVCVCVLVCVCVCVLVCVGVGQGVEIQSAATAGRHEDSEGWTSSLACKSKKVLRATYTSLSSRRGNGAVTVLNTSESF